MSSTLLGVYAPPSPTIIKGYGSTVWDHSGKEYIDLAAGVAVNSLGHCHPALVNTIRFQSESLWHMSNYWKTPQKQELADRLVQASFGESVFLCNSGAEANEAALKTARRYATSTFREDKDHIIAFSKGFHGRTLFTVSAGGTAAYANGFGPKPAHIFHAQYNNIDSFAALISHKTCAVIIEPMLGEGGAIAAEPQFLLQLRMLCNANNALLIFDEVQTGIGRSGKLFMYQSMGVEPDIMTLAKGLGGGFPIGAMVCKKNVASTMSVGSHGSTFGGNPMASAVANTVLKTINTTYFLEQVLNKERYIRDWFSSCTAIQTIFRKVRGQGLLLALELNDSYLDAAESFIATAFNNGVLCLPCNDNAVRLVPALNIEEKELQEGLHRLSASANALLAD